MTCVCVAWIGTINTAARQREHEGRFLPLCQEAFIPSAGVTSTSHYFVFHVCQISSIHNLESAVLDLRCAQTVF